MAAMNALNYETFQYELDVGEWQQGQYLVVPVIIWLRSSKSMARS